ncbi:hypothetical protein C8Q80DRAFT_1353435 [Daedaleopsis nitida]|nr:hypothetical protein C8Q80DRAFT_1353435 [Daedaleopsis nitida]
MAKLTILSAVALACAVAVQGASLGGSNATLVARGCEKPDTTQPECQTTGGSPLVSDCVVALKRLSGQCAESNGGYSQCHTQVQYGTCKIDACGVWGLGILEGVNCGGYLQTILNNCQSGGRVGGYLEPEGCNIEQYATDSDTFWSEPKDYRLQFSHS